MGSHDYHEDLPGYDPRQILHDGCTECEARGKDLALAVAQLDHDRFAAALVRALDRRGPYRHGTHSARDLHISAAEMPLLDVLALVADRIANL